jgi:hypothetical protein
METNMQAAHLSRLVRHYQTHVFLDHHLAFYKHLPSLVEAVEYAALAKLKDGKRHPHQRRISRTTLQTVYEHLLDNQAQLAKVQSFEDILELVANCAVGGFGELARYDTALRLAVYLNVLPQQVYLHSGTHIGANRLGLETKCKYLSVNELPEPLHALPPHQIEDFLCIYKEQLTKFEPDKPIDVKSCLPKERGKSQPVLAGVTDKADNTVACQ